MYHTTAAAPLQAGNRRVLKFFPVFFPGKIPSKNAKKGVDNYWSVGYNGKAVGNAAIAQPVERILGKDEVASSNLASSSRIEDVGQI